jgi:Xaa-Pro aminopeptidase
MTSTPYANRRQRLAAQLGPHAVAIVPTAAVQPRNRDNEHPYRFDSYFYYLTGFTEPYAWLVLDGQGRSTLFCQPKDLAREIWDGYRLGPDAAPATLGVDQAFGVDALETELPKLLANQRAVWWPFATHPGLSERVQNWLTEVRAQARSGISCPQSQHDVCAVLDDMRLIKDDTEQAVMARAGQISAGAHRRAMQHCAQSLRQGQALHEYHLEAELLHEFRRHGAQAPAYPSIVATGANACVLHYRADRAAVRPGDLVLIDAGCELDGYASDITRTFPATGRFDAVQRDVYQVVLAAQHAAVNATRPGARFDDVHQAALYVLCQGMLDLGLLSRTTHGSAEAVMEQRAYTAYYMHRTSHWLGLDVHDVGAYTQADTTGDQRRSRVLQPGMVLTIEPGLYIRAGSDAPEAFHGIGVRIEDDALVTANGCELLTRDVPVEVAAIEALMA